jgi:hypothetical protein
VSSLILAKTLLKRESLKPDSDLYVLKSVLPDPGKDTFKKRILENLTVTYRRSEKCPRNPGPGKDVLKLKKDNFLEWLMLFNQMKDTLPRTPFLAQILNQK